MAEEAILDMEMANTQTDGDKEFLQELLGDLQETVETALTSLPIAIDENNFEKIRNEAHTVKGAALTIGCNALGSVARELEYAAKTADSDKCQTTYPRFVSEFERLKNYVKEM